MSHLHDTRAGVWSLELPWDAPPLSMNDRLHFRPEAKLRSTIRSTGRDLALDLGIPAMTLPTVQLVWLVTTRHKRDAENLAPTLKSLADGLVDAGVAADDTPELMHKPVPIIAYAKGHHKAPGMFLLLWEKEGPTDEERRAADSLAYRLGVHS